MKYEFGLRGHDIGNNFEEMCENAKKFGVKKLQFAMAKTCTDINFDEVGFDEKIASDIKAKLDEYGLHVSVLGCYIDPICRDDNTRKVLLERFRNFILYAKYLGADMIATETGVLATREETWSDENFNFFVDNMRPLIKFAEEQCVTVAIEPVFITTINSPQKMRRMLDEVNSPNLGVLLDVSNLTWAETRLSQCDIINDSFELFGDKIKAIHLKDFMFDDENKKSFALAGSGELMTEMLFDRINALSKLPEIILDETNVNDYAESLEILAEVME